MKLVVPAMLNRLQDLRDAAPRQELCFLMATNFIANIEPALTRPGRLDGLVPVPYPDPWSRMNTLERHLNGEPLEEMLKQQLVLTDTRMWPWSTLDKLCRAVAKEPKKLVRQDVDRFVLQRKREFEPVVAYYKTRDRQEWETSEPLVNEFAYVAFAYSPKLAECESCVQDLPDNVREKLKSALREEFNGQRREQPWQS